MVGLFTFMSIGAAVLYDLWEILDVKKGHTMVSRVPLNRKTELTSQAYFNRHFAYRVIGLIVVPFFLYLLFFWIHFKVLIYSGPGDTFMSPAFQETLQGNELLLNSQGRS
jgi:dolichyl-phosphate-mannose-protein mannosyltransferase